MRSIRRPVSIWPPRLSNLAASARAIDWEPPFAIGQSSTWPLTAKIKEEISASHEFSVNIGAISGPIFCDPYLLDHIFTNLLSNAVKYSPDGCKIEVKGWMEDEQFLVSIRDHGIGISDNDVPRIFERFFRTSTLTGIAGTGIGLYLVKQLVELHGGSIEVESVEGEGSTFTVRLPIQPVEDSSRVAPSERLHPLNSPLLNSPA